MSDHPTATGVTRAWAAWLSTGAPAWDACADCGHRRWAHLDGPCDRMSEAAHYQKPCRCKAFSEPRAEDRAP